MANIWATVLGLEQVGVRDNFFSLGGHSLLAAQVVARIRAALNLEVPLRALFQYPTIEELIRHLDESRNIEAPALRPVPRQAATPASFAQQRLWFLNELDPGSSYNMSRALRLQGRLDRRALQETLNALEARHESLRTSFESRDGKPMQVVSAPGTVNIEAIDLSGQAPVERELHARRLSAAASLRPFDLSSEQLFRAILFRFDEEDHVLLLVTHHIVSDGWSMTVMLREIGSLYASFVESTDSDLPRLPVQYADFALWQDEWFQSAGLRDQVQYWKKKLAAAPALLELPTDRARPAMQSSRAPTIQPCFRQPWLIRCVRLAAAKEQRSS